MTILSERPPAAGTATGGVAVAMQHVSKRFGRAADSVLALEDVSLTVRAGEFLCLVGPSGCGKSTLLNFVAGLDHPSTGNVTVPGGSATLMFQEAALFPWLTVEQNVEFPLRMRRAATAGRRRRVADLLAMVHLDGFGRKRPHQLSGGMRQRVALARALAQEPAVLLMDEPFGSLDAMMRDILHEELERLWQQAGLTVIFVTHDVREAVRLGDRVLLMSRRPGRIVDEFPNPLPRPRTIESVEVVDLAASITARLREEARRDVAA